jgi:hypothetical protein
VICRTPPTVVIGQRRRHRPGPGDLSSQVSDVFFGGVGDLLNDVLRGDHTLVIGVAILSELEAVLVEIYGWASDPAAAVRAELEAITDVVTPV